MSNLSQEVEGHGMSIAMNSKHITSLNTSTTNLYKKLSNSDERLQDSFNKITDVNETIAIIFGDISVIRDKIYQVFLTIFLRYSGE